MTNAEPVSEEELRRLCDFLYRQTGMMFGDNKRYYIERRVAERMQAAGTSTFNAYFSRLRGDLSDEIEQLINAFTVNETYFYREEHQLACLTNDLLRERVAKKAPGEAVRIWSAPCSTGEEPYSIAIWMLENWPLVDDFNIEIIGSDIDTRVLDAARAGLYTKRALMRMTPPLIERYFHAVDGENWRILDELRESVQFTPVNIVEPAETRPHGKFDVIFCRNVLIYFDDASRRIATDNLYENLAPGGFICLGHSESMSRISSLFDVRRFGDAIVYQKPLEGSRG